MASWPITLPTGFFQRDYEESPPNLLLRSQMDEGPAKVRRRFTAGVRPIRGKIKLTPTQVGILDDFYVDDCDSGATAFTYTHPRTGASVLVRWVEPPKYKPQGLNYLVDISLEILP
jgi:hypothetical protein